MRFANGANQQKIETLANVVVPVKKEAKVGARKETQLIATIKPVVSHGSYRHMKFTETLAFEYLENKIWFCLLIRFGWEFIQRIYTSGSYQIMGGLAFYPRFYQQFCVQSGIWSQIFVFFLQRKMRFNISLQVKALRNCVSLGKL